MENVFEKAKEFILYEKRTTIKKAAESIDYTRQHLTNVLNRKTNCGPKLAQRLHEWSGGKIILPTKNGAEAPTEAEG